MPNTIGFGAGVVSENIAIKYNIGDIDYRAAELLEGKPGDINPELLASEHIQAIQQQALDARNGRILLEYFNKLEQAKKNELREITKRQRECQTQKLAFAMLKNPGKSAFFIGVAIGLSLPLIIFVVLEAIFPKFNIFSRILSRMAAAIFGINVERITIGMVTTALAFKTKPNTAEEAALDQKLKAAETIEQKIIEDLKKIKAAKLASTRTLKIITKSSAAHSDTLNLSCQRGEPAIGDIGVSNICLHLTAATLENPSPYHTLDLTNNDITGAGVAALAETLLRGQAQHSLNIEKIYLSGNPLDHNSYTILQNTLSQVFSIVELTVTNAPEDIDKEIKRQLLINKYLKREDLDGELNLKPTAQLSAAEIAQIEELFGIPGLENLKQAVLMKVKSNYNLLFFPGRDLDTLPTALKNIVEQNRIFARLYNNPTFEDYLNAMEIDSTRCREFISHESLAQEKRMAIKAIITKGIFALRFKSIEECQKSLLIMFTQEEQSKNQSLPEHIRLFANIITRLPQSPQPTPLDDQIAAYIQEIFDSLNTETTSFKQALTACRNKIATDPSFANEAQKRAILDTFDYVLPPKLGALSQQTFEIFRLRRLTAEPLQDRNKTFEEFINIYNNLDTKILANINLNELVELVRASIYDDSKKDTLCTLLKQLDEEHRVALLTACFQNTSKYQSEKDASAKAEFISRLITTEEIFSDDPEMKKFRNHYLYYAIRQGDTTHIEPYTYEEVRKGLETLRHNYAINPNMSAEERKAKLNTLDQILHPELGNPDSIKFKIYQLQMLIKEHAKDPDGTAFLEFLQTYHQFTAKDLDTLYNPPLSPNAQENLKLFLLMVNKLNDFVGTDGDIHLQMDIDKYLQSAVERLEEDPSKFRKGLEDLRTEFATELKPNEKLLDTLDAILLGENVDLAILNAHKLRKLLTEHQDDQREALQAFINLYKKLSPETFAAVCEKLSQNEQNELVALVRTDIYDSENQSVTCTQLKGLDEPQRIALLTAVFSNRARYQNETSPKEKAELVTKILAATKIMTDANPLIKEFRDTYLRGAIEHKGIGREPYTYEETQKALETLRQTLASQKVDTDEELEEKRRRLGVIDIILNPNLKPDSPELQLYQLQKLANEKIPANETDRFHEFIAIYKNIQPETALTTTLATMNQDELVALIRADVYDNTAQDTVCTLLKKLDEPHRLALLTACFSNKSKYQSEESPGLKAQLISEMIANDGLFADDPEIKKLRDEYLRYAIQQGRYHGEPYTYQALLDAFNQQLEDAKQKKLVAKVEMLETIINQSLPKKLVAEFQCLRGAEDLTAPTFRALKAALASPEYEYLTDPTTFEYGTHNVNPPIQEYIRHICQLRKTLAASDLDGFITEYLTTAEKDRPDLLGSLDSAKILQLLATDLGPNDTNVPCNKLQDLARNQPEILIALLTHGFEIKNPKEAREKARLICAALADQEIFANTSIKQAIYWAIKPYNRDGSPYHNLSSLTKALPKIEPTAEEEAKHTRSTPN